MVLEGGTRHFCFVLVLIEVSKKGPALLQLSVCFLFRLRLQEVSGSLNPGLHPSTGLVAFRSPVFRGLLQLGPFRSVTGRAD